MTESLSAGQVVQQFKEDFIGAYEKLTATVND